MLLLLLAAGKAPLSSLGAPGWPTWALSSWPCVPWLASFPPSSPPEAWPLHGQSGRHSVSPEGLCRGPPIHASATFPACGASDILRGPMDVRARHDPQGSQCQLIAQLTLSERSQAPCALLGIGAVWEVELEPPGSSVAGIVLRK